MVFYILGKREVVIKSTRARFCSNKLKDALHFPAQYSYFSTSFSFVWNCAVVKRWFWLTVIKKVNRNNLIVLLKRPRLREICNRCIRHTGNYWKQLKLSFFAFGPQQSFFDFIFLKHNYYTSHLVKTCKCGPKFIKCHILYRRHRKRN